jgi:streptomycin 6-kinase
MTMDTVDGKSNAPSGENQNALDVSAETRRRTQLQQRIEAQRMQLLQAYGVLKCLYRALLHAEDDDAVCYAQAAHVAAKLIDDTAEELDSVHIGPLIMA